MPTSPKRSRYILISLLVGSGVAVAGVALTQAPGASSGGSTTPPPAAIPSAKAAFFRSGVDLQMGIHPAKKGKEGDGAPPSEPNEQLNLPTGLLLGAVSPIFPSGTLLLSPNMWQSVKGNHITSIYAGISPSNRDQGLIIVMGRQVDPRPVVKPHPTVLDAGTSIDDHVSVVPTPTAVGPVTIVAAKGPLITVKADNGESTFTFDGESLKFVG